MIAWPSPSLVHPVVAITDDRFGIGGSPLSSIGSAFGSATWSGANRAWIMPLYVPDFWTVDKLWVCNGTVVSGNLDIGIFTESFAKVVSTGATAQAGTSAVQTVDVTNTLLRPGRYWMAMSMDNATGTVLRWSSGGINLRALGITYQDTAYTLPSTLTPVANTGGWHVPLIGLSLRATV